MATVKVDWSHILMVFGGVMFGEIVRFIHGAGFPKDVKVVLGDLISDPVESHVDGSGFLLLDGVVGDAAGR